jgi:N-acetylglucosamine kinase-like BadF-type ATPase
MLHVHAGAPAARADAAVVAVDVGNSKTDVAIVARSGEVLAAGRGPTVSHQQVGPAGAADGLGRLVEVAMEAAGLDASRRPVAELVVCSAAGADFPADVRLIARGIRGLGLAPAEIVTNDCHGGLRAGTGRSWGVCVICGSGMNCLGRSPGGREARFAALGELSGDWGGGGALGRAGLAAAVRAEDGRGPRTLLARTVPAHFGVATPGRLTIALYRGRIPWRRVLEIAPLVFEAATAGDHVARSIVDRQADEIVAWASSAIRRAGLGRRDPDVVLAGGVFHAEDPAFYARIEAGVRAAAPRAKLVRLLVPPVVGAALIGLDGLLGGETPPEVETKLRAELTENRLLRAIMSNEGPPMGQSRKNLASEEL